MVKLHRIEDKTCHSLGWFPLWLQIINDVYYVYNCDIEQISTFDWTFIHGREIHSTPSPMEKLHLRKNVFFDYVFGSKLLRIVFLFLYKVKTYFVLIRNPRYHHRRKLELMSVNQWWLNVCLIDWMSRRLSIIILKVLTQGWFVSVI